MNPTTVPAAAESAGPESVRRSPIHDSLVFARPTWGTLAGMAVPLDFGHAPLERIASRKLGLCDLSYRPRMTVKGPRAADWLGALGAPIPSAIYDMLALPDGGLVVRTGGSEFFLEDGSERGWVAETLLPAEPTEGVIKADRQDASFLLTGDGAREVFSQTCGYEFRPGVIEFVFTRIIGVSCAVTSRNFGELPAYQLWLDGTYGVYVWETLAEIVEELGGKLVGLACLSPEPV